MIKLLLRRWKWTALFAGVRYVARRSVGRSVSRSVDDATAELEQRLPAPVTKAANALPGDLMRVGGAAAVGVRAARRGTSIAQRTTHRPGTAPGGRDAVSPEPVPRRRSRLADRLHRARSTVIDQIDADRHEIRTDYSRHVAGTGSTGFRNIGDASEFDAQLDLRTIEEPGPVPGPVTTPPAVPRGRFRRRRRPAPEVARARRSYRRPTKPWEADPPTTGR